MSGWLRDVSDNNIFQKMKIWIQQTFSLLFAMQANGSLVCSFEFCKTIESSIIHAALFEIMKPPQYYIFLFCYCLLKEYSKKKWKIW